MPVSEIIDWKEAFLSASMEEIELKTALLSDDIILGLSEFADPNMIPL